MLPFNLAKHKKGALAFVRSKEHDSGHRYEHVIVFGGYYENHYEEFIELNLMPEFIAHGNNPDTDDGSVFGDPVSFVNVFDEETAMLMTLTYEHVSYLHNERT